MKKVLSLLLVFVLAMGICPAQASEALDLNNTTVIEDDSSYKGRNDIEKIVFPEHITYVGNRAFENCENLKEVVFPDTGSIEFGWDVFKNCTSLTEITLAGGIKEIKYPLFEGCDNLKAVNIGLNFTLPPGDTSIFDRKIENYNVEEGNPRYEVVDGVLIDKEKNEPVNCTVSAADNIVWSYEDNVLTIDGYGGVDKNVDVPWADSVEEITGSFPVMYALTPTKKVVVGKDVSSIEYITNSTQLTYGHIEAFEVHPDNKFYSSVDGVLFNKNKTKLIKFPTGKKMDEYIVPETVREFGSGTFRECKIGSVVLPEGIERLPSFYAADVPKVTIPKSVTQIDSVFSGSISRYTNEGGNTLEEIIYTGTIKEWTDTKKFSSHNMYNLEYTSQGNLLDYATKYYADKFVYVDGRLVELTAPINQRYNKVMVPMRGICEALGYTVTWNSEEMCAIATKEGKEVKFPVYPPVYLTDNEIYFDRENVEMYVNGKGVKVRTERTFTSRGETIYQEISHRALLENGITMVSVKAIDDAFGVKLGWNETFDCMSFTTEGFKNVELKNYITDTQSINFNFNGELSINGYEGIVTSKEDIENILTIVSEASLLENENMNSWLPVGEWLSFTVNIEDNSIYIAINHEDMLVKTAGNRSCYKIHDAEKFTQKLLSIFSRNADMERSHLKYNRERYSVTPYVIDNEHYVTYEQLMNFVNETGIKLRYTLEDGVLSVQNAYGKIQEINPLVLEDGRKFYSLKDITNFMMYYYSVDEETGFVGIRKPWNIA